MLELDAHNPWWQGRQRIEDDQDYRRWLTSRVRWRPRLLDRISLERPSLSFLLGPRQVGKTTLIKLLVKRLLDEGVNPEAVFYYRCDQLADYKELDQVLREYMKYRELRGLGGAYIFLDEVTFPSQWYRSIKYHIDMGRLAGDSVILSGSLSMFALREIETFPGRRGKGRDYVMYPLSFREFVKVARPEMNLEDSLDLQAGKLAIQSSRLLGSSDELLKLFEMYLISGGFPTPVKAVLQSGSLSQEDIDTYLSWIKGDLARVRANESFVKRVLKAVIEKAPSRLSLNSVAKEFEIGSHKTVFKYLDLLEKLFVLKVLYYIDPDKGSEDYAKKRKVHITDPFLYRALSHWCLARRPEDSVLAESVVASHLARRFDVGYWSDGTEIDVVVRHELGLTGIEVKYQERPRPTHLAVGKIKEVITLSKDSFQREPPMAPIAVFLALLDA